MKTKQIVIVTVLSMAALFASASQSHAFLDKVFGGDDKPAHKSKGKSSFPVHIGMTMDEVREKLGEPDSEMENSDGNTEWRYNPDSIANRLQDDTVHEVNYHAASSIPFVGGILGDAADRASTPIKAKRVGYNITFSGGKVSSISKMKMHM